jgi:hypothetical protein
MKFTAIYVESWMSGSHHHSITKMKRVEQQKGETVVGMLERNFIKDETVFIFEG